MHIASVAIPLKMRTIYSSSESLLRDNSRRRICVYHLVSIYYARTASSSASIRVYWAIPERNHRYVLPNQCWPYGRSDPLTNPLLISSKKCKLSNLFTRRCPFDRDEKLILFSSNSDHSLMFTPHQNNPFTRQHKWLSLRRQNSYSLAKNDALPVHKIMIAHIHGL